MGNENVLKTCPKIESRSMGKYKYPNTLPKVLLQT